jgi:hypothetical protein
MGILAPMAHNDVRRRTRLQTLEPILQFGALVREEAVAELAERDVRTSGAFEELPRGRAGFFGARSDCAENGSAYLKANPALHPAEQGGSAADLYIVGVGSEAQDGKALAG